MNFTIPAQKVSWHELTWKERRNLAKVILWPYKNRTHNIILYIQFIIALTITILFINTLMDMSTIMLRVTTGWHRSWYFGTSLGMTWILAVGCTTYIINSIKKALQYEQDILINNMMSGITEEFKKYQDEMIESLKEKSGRTEISKDPVTLLAAAIDASDKKAVRKTDSKTNPLRALLENDLSVLDDLENNDDLEI